MPPAVLPTSRLDALLRLLACGRPQAPLRRLLDTHGSAEAALAAGSAEWASHGLRESQLQALRQPDPHTIARCQRWLQRPGCHVLAWQEADYPPLLRRIASPPLLLFIEGDVGALWKPAVAVVGSRAATAGGCANAAQFAQVLADAGLCVVSGLAAGIDTAAHHAACDRPGTSVAVLGTGPERTYPVENTALREAILAGGGAIVSEHPPGTAPLRAHFPSRNRILAGLCVGTLVVEAAERSGALITARLAAEAGREVMAIPGSIHNPMARGCHRLLREGATLVESPQEVLQLLAPAVAQLAACLRGQLDVGTAAASAPPETTTEEDADHKLLWSALGHDPTDMDQLVQRTGLTAASLSAMLLALELDGRVAVEHGRYVRIGR